jgi:lambda family phage portal protein
MVALRRPARIAPLSRRASRNAGAFRGSLSAWRPPQAFSLEQQARERKVAQGRAADLTANDWAATSGINAITTNAVGTGLRPQSRLNAKRLGITPDQARDLQSEIEFIWQGWCQRAHVRGMLHFEDLQFLGLRTMLRMGELLHLPVMRDAPGRTLQLAIQDVLPSRLRTPLDYISNPNIVDGVELASYGAPVAYWLATPQAQLSRALDMSSLGSDQFTRIPATLGHRPNCFHLFRYNEDEQVRGESVLAPGMKLFRHHSDSRDNELLAQVVTASMAMFIAREEGATAIPGYVREDTDEETGERTYYENISPGTIMYGNKDEKPYMLESSRPSPNFSAFSELVLRAMAASLDMPYEVLSKDFSKTNYSSARAALLEAWRVYVFYRSWLERHYCRPIWSMVIEEAWLTGLLTFPSGAPDFYDAVPLYTSSIWIGPARGYVDPVKEINATIKALENRLMTYSEALAERGRDFDEVMDEREEEEPRLAAFTSQPTKASTFKEQPEENNVSR